MVRDDRRRAGRVRLSALSLWEAPMAIGPGYYMAAAATGRGHLRASDADREQVVDTLKAAFVHGRLTRGELDLRAGQALTSRTYADLAAVTAGIPTGLIESEPPPKPTQAPALKPVSKKAIAWSTGLIILPPALGAAFLTYYGGFFVLFLFAFIGFAVTAKP
jgi:hypothetical protein